MTESGIAMDVKLGASLNASDPIVLSWEPAPNVIEFKADFMNTPSPIVVIVSGMIIVAKLSVR